jgi:hypothetical protein
MTSVCLTVLFFLIQRVLHAQREPVLIRARSRCSTR